MDFKFERICIWVKILIGRSQNDHTEVFGVIADFGHCGVNEGSVVVHVFQGYQHGSSPSGRGVTYGQKV